MPRSAHGSGLRTLGFLLAAAAVWAATACGSDRQAAPAASAPETLGPAVRWALLPPPKTLDPAFATTASELELMFQIYAGLVSIGPDLRIAPGLAVAVPDPIVHADGTLAYTFELRDDARFHDGRPVTAGDVKWSIERLARSSPVFIAYIADVVGARAFVDGTAADIAGIRVPDATRVEITAAAGAGLLAKLAYAFVLDRRQIEADPDGWAAAPNGTGPFRVLAWREGEGLDLVRALPSDDPNAVQRVDVRFVPASLAAYENDEFDIIRVSDAELLAARSPGLVPAFRSIPTLWVIQAVFNVRRPPFDDPSVRRAFALAIDRRELETLLFGAVTAVAGFLPPGLDSRAAQDVDAAYDPDAARAELAASPYAGADVLRGLRFLVPAQGGVPIPAVEAMLRMWHDALGVDLTVEAVEVAAFQHLVTAAGFDVALQGFGADYPDPEPLLDWPFRSGHVRNYSGFADPELDRRLDAARAATTAADRAIRFAEAGDYLAALQPSISLASPNLNVLVRPTIAGYIDPPVPMPWLEHLRWVR